MLLISVTTVVGRMIETGKYVVERYVSANGNEPAKALPEGKKLVHLIRHGQAVHNMTAELEEATCVCTEQQKCVYNRVELVDAHLTA